MPGQHRVSGVYWPDRLRRRMYHYAAGRKYQGGQQQHSLRVLQVLWYRWCSRVCCQPSQLHASLSRSITCDSHICACRSLHGLFDSEKSGRCPWHLGSYVFQCRNQSEESILDRLNLNASGRLCHFKSIKSIKLREWTTWQLEWPGLRKCFGLHHGLVPYPSTIVLFGSRSRTLLPGRVRKANIPLAQKISYIIYTYIYLVIQLSMETSFHQECQYHSFCIEVHEFTREIIWSIFFLTFSVGLLIPTPWLSMLLSLVASPWGHSLFVWKQTWSCVYSTYAQAHVQNICAICNKKLCYLQDTYRNVYIWMSLMQTRNHLRTLTKLGISEIQL